MGTNLRIAWRVVGTPSIYVLTTYLRRRKAMASRLQQQQQQHTEIAISPMS